MDNTQTQIELTPLMSAAIATLRKTLRSNIGREESELLDGIINAFRFEVHQASEPLVFSESVRAELMSQGVEIYKACLMDFINNSFEDKNEIPFDDPELAIQALLRRIAGTKVRDNREMIEYDAALMKLITDALNYDPFLDEFSTPTEGIEILGRQLRNFSETNRRLLLELEQSREARHEIQIQLNQANERIESLLGQINENLEETTSGLDRLEPKGPTPVPKKLDGRKKQEPDLGLSDLAKVFNQKGVPGLGALRKHLPQVCRHLFGDGITSVVSIAKQIVTSNSDAAALVKVANACREASGGVSTDEFMTAIKEVSA
jgi:hypothetical protein